MQSTAMAVLPLLGYTKPPNAWTTLHGSYRLIRQPAPPVSAVAASGTVEYTYNRPRKGGMTSSTTTHPLPSAISSSAAEKAEIIKSLESWASEKVVPLLKPVNASWQPCQYLPDPSKSIGSSDGDGYGDDDLFSDEVRTLRDRVAQLPDELLVVLVGDMITEEALPTYQTWINTLEGVRDQTSSSPGPWATWTRGWTAEEKRHGDLLKTYLYLSGRVDMLMIERTVQYLIGAGMDLRTENNAYLGFVYTSFQERATSVSHGNTARLAKESGDPILARICGIIASDEKRHEMAYCRIVEKLVEVDPNGAMLAIGDMMRKKITMPAHMMYDGRDPKLFQHFSLVAQRTGVYTANDYADIVEHLIRLWRLEKLEGLSSEAKEAQEFVCGLGCRIRKIQERAEERAHKLQPRGVKFSWIFDKELFC